MESTAKLASRLKRRITIEQLVLTSDGAGGFSESWNQFNQVWAEVSPLNGQEILYGEQLITKKKYTITIRYIEGVNENMRLWLGARSFNIVSILNPYEENILLEISAEEIV